ncbi:hypothetical protein GQ53DRAFT_523038 [Thozetella sp. PMI_491]|nr:hypothetical protein GQ53DRAFT_523038 [Thozetella sp. PMI_491]
MLAERRRRSRDQDCNLVGGGSSCIVALTWGGRSRWRTRRRRERVIVTEIFCCVKSRIDAQSMLQLPVKKSDGFSVAVRGSSCRRVRRFVLAEQVPKVVAGSGLGSCVLRCWGSEGEQRLHLPRSGKYSMGSGARAETKITVRNSRGLVSISVLSLGPQSRC